MITLFFLIDNISHGAMHVLVCVCVCECLSVYACMCRDGVSECAKREEWKGVEKNEKEK